MDKVNHGKIWTRHLKDAYLLLQISKFTVIFLSSDCQIFNPRLTYLPLTIKYQ